MMVAFKRRALAWVLALALVSVSAVGSVAFAQDTTPVAEPQTTTQTTQPVENEDDGFPWGLLGLLGLGGLAGLRRQEQPVQRVETIDASRRA